LLVLLMTAVTGAWADGERTSHWPDFSPENYEKNNTLVAGIMIDGVIITADYDGWDQLEVAPFIGDECRCVHGESASYLYNGYVQEYGDPFPVLDGMLIFYNGEGGDEVTFKMYNHATGVEYTACDVTYLGDPITIKTGDEHMEGWDDPENPVFLNFTTPEPAAPAAYTVSMKESTEDATNWTIAPAEATTAGVAAGTTVTATYSGTKRVKSVKAKKKAAAPAYTLLSAATTSDQGKVVCAAGHLHDAKTAVPTGCTAVGILGKVTETGHGLILALANATSQSWNTINGWTSVTTYAGTTLKQLPDDDARGSLTSYTTLGSTAVSNWAVAQKSDYEAIFTNLGSTTADSDGTTYDSNVDAYITTGVGGTAISDMSWSATEYDSGRAWDFQSRWWAYLDKDYSRSVRPVLAF
jgi:hypothetical protein